MLGFGYSFMPLAYYISERYATPRVMLVHNLHAWQFMYGWAMGGTPGTYIHISQSAFRLAPEIWNELRGLNISPFETYPGGFCRALLRPIGRPCGCNDLRFGNCR